MITELIDYEVLKVIWWVFVGILFIGFTLTDGFDIGIGALLPFIGKTDHERRVVINTIAPHWDGNQVWLILAAGAIFAAWPAVYGAAFSSFYIPMMLILFALFFRPVGFDYRSKIANTTWRHTWDWGLFISGVIPPIIIGIAFGNLLLGIPFSYNEILSPTYTGSFLQLLNPFGLLVGVVSLSLFIMHGAVYLQLRTEKAIRQRAQSAAQIFSALLILCFGLAGIWLSLGIDGYIIIEMPALDALPNPTAKLVEPSSGAWLFNYTQESIFYPWSIAAPVLGFLGAIGVFLLTTINRPQIAFFCSAFSIIGIIMTAGISLFPFIMPSNTVPSHSLTIWDAASSHLTLTIMFWATVIFLPIIIIYTSWCYKALWGKVTVDYIKENEHSVY